MPSRAETKANRTTPNRTRPSPSRKVSVFISYSSRNLKLAEAVHAALENAGFGVWRDKQRLKSDWSAEIAAALTRVDLLCLLWTEEAAKSAFVQHEWLTARALEKAIVPCLLPQAPKLPQPIENLQGVVLSDKRQALHRLIKYLRSRTAFQTKYDFRAPPIRGFMPFAPDENFIGREQDLLAIYLSLLGQLNKIGFSRVGILGMGGVGKTQLAVEFAHRFGFAFDGVYWIQGTEPRQLADELVRLARDRLGLKISHPKSADASSRYLLELLSYSKAHPQMLLLIDNVADPSILLNTSTVPGGSFAVLDFGCGLLFSTRRQFQLKGVQSHLLDVLAPEAAVRLLTGDRSDLGNSDRGIAEQICNAVGFLPLALALIAAYLRNYPQVTLARYLENLRRNHLAAIDATKINASELATRHEAAVGTTLRSQWKMLKAPDARLALKILAHLPEGTITPNARIGLLTGLRDRESNVRLPLARAINALAELSLISKVGDAAVRIHPLIAEFVRKVVPNRTRARFLSAAAMKVKAAYRDPLRLNTEFETRGIDQVIGDLDTAVTWSDGDRQLSILNRLFDRERANLRPDEKRAAKLSANFFQQLHQRAAMLGLPQLAAEFLRAGRRAQRARVMLRVCGSSAPEDLAQVRTFGGRHSSVMDLAISADGQRLITASARELTLWDVANGQILRVLKRHRSIITAVAISPDGFCALSGGWDKKLICWDLATGEKFWQAQDHEDDIYFVAMTSDGATALTGSLDKTLLRWDVASGRRLSRLEGHQAGVTKGSITRDGRYAVSADTSGEIFIWDLRQESVLYQFQLEDSADGIKRQITALQLSPDGKMAAIATGYIGAAADWFGPDRNGRLILWDLDRRREVSQLKGHSGVVQAVAFSDDGRQLFSGSSDKTCKLWDIATARCRRTFIGHRGEVTAVAFASGDRYAVSGGWDGDALLWELAAPAGRLSNSAKGALAHSLWVRSADISEDGSVALTGSDDKSVILWNPANGLPVRTLQEHGESVKSVKLTADAANAVSGDEDGALVLWDVRKGEPSVKFDTRKGRIHAVNISADKRTLFTGSNFSWVIAWDASTRELLRGFTHPKAFQEDDSDGITAIVVSDDGLTAISAGEDSKKLLQWDLKNNSSSNKVAAFKGQSAGILALDRSRDGTRLLSGSSDCTAILWDVESHQPLLQLKGHTSAVNGVAIATDGLAVTISLDNTLILWDLQSGEPLTRLFFDGLLSAAAARGKRVVVADRGGSVYFFEIELPGV